MEHEDSMYLTNFELMKFQSVSIPTISHIDSQAALVAILLPYNIQWKLKGHTINHFFNVNGVMDDIFYRNSYHINSVKLFTALESTVTLHWKSAYN